MLENQNSEIAGALNSSNYFLNCYLHLIRIKGIYLLFILIEIILNILYELEIFMKDFEIQNISYYNLRLNYVTSINNIFQKIPVIIKFSLLLIFIIILDSLTYFIKIKIFKQKILGITIIVTLLEIFFFRTIMLLFLNLFFTIDGFYFLIACIFIILHILYIMNNFKYNHLYYFVPEFIDYPYDEFSSTFDIILLFIKILLSISGTTNKWELRQFCFYIVFFMQIFFSIYFINLLFNHSYLFMKNSFLNRTRLDLFFTKTFIIILALLFGKDEIMTVLFLIICFILIIANIGYMYCIYNPYLYIKVKRETPMSNLFFYLYILSAKNDYNFLLEKKVQNHFEICGICDLCNKFNKYLKRYNYKTNNQNEENEKLINEENINKINDNNNEKLMDLFDVLNDKKNKYFELIKQIVLNYKYKGKEALNNNYYYINLSFLIYSDYLKKNITLSLNERIILKVINQNCPFLENHESQINQLILCNNFIELSKKVLAQLRDILNCEPNFYKAKKIIDLSYLVKNMENKKFKENLFAHKLENLSNSRHFIIICSIIYEEIFNMTLNDSKFPIRDNIQAFEDIFNTNKINKIITLSLDLTKKSCKIIRAGKDLYSYINKDLFDLFPLIFKEYQINLFMSSILNNFWMDENKEKININSGIKRINKIKIKSSKNVQRTQKALDYNKDDYIEINLIISEKMFSKIYYKLLNLKLSPLFNNDNHHYILFNGLFFLNQNTLITLQDFEENLNTKEKLIGVSEPYLEKLKDVYSMSFKKYISWQNSQGYSSSKILSFTLSYKLYQIYVLNNEGKEIGAKKNQRKSGQSKRDMIEDEDEESSLNKNPKIEKVNIIEDNASVSSGQTGNSYSNAISVPGMNYKSKNNIYEYGGFNKIIKISNFTIIGSIIILIGEIFFLSSLETSTKNNNESLLQYREFAKLYYQLFSSILGVTCIYSKNFIKTLNNCTQVIDIFTTNYFGNDKNNVFNYTLFNYTLFSIIQNEILAKEIMNKRNNLANIHKNIGKEKYNELFGKQINYIRVGQNIINGKSYYYTTKINMQFSEAILIICNSFQLLSKESNDSMILLNKEEDPFSLINSWQRGIIIINETQISFYEMILNYKYYNKEFLDINDKLLTIIVTKSSFIEIFIYICIAFNTLLLLFISILMLLYGISFEKILIKIINHINMIMNAKSDEFNLCDIYQKKIENLEAILQFYKVAPDKTIKNLNNIYNKYQQYLTSKNKNNSKDMINKNKKIMEKDKKNELDDIPKSQRIITRKDINTLGIIFIYKFFFFLNLFLIFSLFIITIVLWLNYFSKKTNLYNFLSKNMSIEMALYRAINSYDIMIFQNISIYEIGNIVLPNYKKEEEYVILESLYNDLKFAFNNQKEKNYIKDIYIDLEDKTNFTCENLFIANNEHLQKIANHSKGKSLKNILHNLIKICELSGITETNDFRTTFDNFVQLTRNGIISLIDYSYQGILEHLINGGTLPKLSLYFNIFIISILQDIYDIPQKDAIQILIKKMKILIKITEVIYFIFNIVVILFLVAFYFPGINNLCNQIFTLRKIFKITEIQE